LAEFKASNFLRIVSPKSAFTPEASDFGFIVFSAGMVSHILNNF